MEKKCHQIQYFHFTCSGHIVKYIVTMHSLQTVFTLYYTILTYYNRYYQFFLEKRVLAPYWRWHTFHSCNSSANNQHNKHGVAHVHRLVGHTRENASSVQTIWHDKAPPNSSSNLEKWCGTTVQGRSRCAIHFRVLWPNVTKVLCIKLPGHFVCRSQKTGYDQREEKLWKPKVQMKKY